MDDEREIEAVLSGICSDERVQKMKEFVQHGKVSTYEHCKSVAKLSYKINKNLRLKSDLKVLLTGAMLHDFYLYDWHDFSDKSHSLHGIKHAERASRNAEKYFILPEPAEHADPDWFGFLLTCRAGVDRTKVVRYVEEHGIQTRMLFAGNLTKHPCFDDMRKTGQGYRIAGSLENTDRIMRDTFWVGV